MKKIIFVCHGNICRSPAAEIVFKKELHSLGLEDEFSICSRALTTEEIGNDIYPPMKRELISKGYSIPLHSATLMSKQEFNEADYIIYMDSENLYLLRRYSDNLDKCIPASLFCSNGEIEDPWYTGRYAYVLAQIEEVCKMFGLKLSKEGQQ